MAANRSIYDFIKSPEIKEYIDQIVLTLTIIRGELRNFFQNVVLEEAEQKEMQHCTQRVQQQLKVFEQCNIRIFGGFVRDLIAGVPLEKLKTKDVDVFISDTEHIESLFSYKAADLVKLKTSSIFSSFRSVKRDRVNHMIQSYVTFRYEIDEVKYDLCFRENADRFKTMHDFTCNNLYFDISDGFLHTRLPELGVPTAISDILHRRLRNMTVCTHKLYRPLIHSRVQLLESYGRTLYRRRGRLLSSGYAEASLYSPYSEAETSTLLALTDQSEDEESSEDNLEDDLDRWGDLLDEYAAEKEV